MRQQRGGGFADGLLVKPPQQGAGVDGLLMSPSLACRREAAVFWHVFDWLTAFKDIIPLANEP